MSYPPESSGPHAMKVVGSIHWSSSTPSSCVMGWIRQHDGHIKMDLCSSILHGTLRPTAHLTRATPRNIRHDTLVKGRFDSERLQSGRRATSGQKYRWTPTPYHVARWR